MSSLRKTGSFVAVLASLIASIVFATTPANASMETVFGYYSGPYSTQQQCEANRPSFHDPENGMYAVWPCTYANHWGPGWYFYYRVYEV